MEENGNLKQDEHRLKKLDFAIKLARFKIETRKKIK